MPVVLVKISFSWLRYFLAFKKGAGINKFVCAVSLYFAETPKTSIKDHEFPFPIIA